MSQNKQEKTVMPDQSETFPEHHLWPNELLTVKEIADYLRVSRMTIWRWCQHGIIPAFQVGRNWRVRRTDFLAFEANLKEKSLSADDEQDDQD
jgi:excisionase family DNA binding protein